ncbi:MAG: hypothetical protein ACXVAU_04120 [Mucilaginibacter sp.]
MKTKPILIAAGILVLLACVFLFVRSRNLVRPEKNEVVQFLRQFEIHLTNGPTDSAKSCFAIDRHSKIVTRLVNILSNKTPADGQENKLFKLSLDVENARITFVNRGLVQADIPVYFAQEKIAGEKSFLILKIQKTADHQLKIVQVDARQLLADYIAYKKKVESLSIPDKDIFDPITLASFKIAEKLKSNYDSVLYFEHIDNKTYYYVAKGKFATYSANGNGRETPNDYKIGLVNPDLKEIIPVEYDVIHNIGGTIDGLIEVEKDSKKGCFDTTGKAIVLANYDQLLPLDDESNLALLRNGDDYFYLKKDMSISDKLVDFKIATVFKKIKNLSNSSTFSAKGLKIIIEANSRDNFIADFFPPSYLVDLSIVNKTIEFPNPLRKMSSAEKEEDEEYGTLYCKISFDGYKPEDKNWLETAYYSVVDDYLGGRGGLYETKNVLAIDNKSNKIMGFGVDSYSGIEEAAGQLSGACNDNHFRQINDTLFEFKTTSLLDLTINETDISEAPRYHYLHIVNGKLVALPNERLFGFTQYVKMDDSYLSGCYIIDDKQTDHLTPEILQYIKNEIFASYRYKFKNEKWTKQFEYNFGRSDGANNVTVDDSLTAIDKYNIAWINQKLKGQKTNSLAAK